jgi:hypothetical protein
MEIDFGASGYEQSGFGDSGNSTLTASTSNQPDLTLKIAKKKKKKKRTNSHSITTDTPGGGYDLTMSICSF